MQKHKLVYGSILEMNHMITEQLLNPLNSNQALQIILITLVSQT